MTSGAKKRFQVQPVTEGLPLENVKQFDSVKDQRVKTSKETTNHLSLFLDRSQSDNDDDNDDAKERETPMATFLRNLTIQTEPEMEANKKTKAKLGCLLGSYFPNVQNVLGVMMFLRLYWIVGVAGVYEAFAIVLLCCLSTFFTSFSISAIATNGVVESGGSYFMISRNLGPEFGTAVGIMFYLANTIGCAMYATGAVEILVKYVLPESALFGEHEDIENSTRIYGTIFIIIIFLIVLCGVKFVQIFAPISLGCVLLAVLAVYIGAFVTNETNSKRICILGDRLLKYDTYYFEGNNYCQKDVFCDQIRPNETIYCPVYLWYCKLNVSEDCKYFENNEIYNKSGLPGVTSGVIKDNLESRYTDKHESSPGVQGREMEVYSDMKTSLGVLMAIFFPAVTGILSGSNMSGDLKNPQMAIPLGTIAAQLTTSFIFLSFTVMFGLTIDRLALTDKFGDSFAGRMVKGRREMMIATLAWPSKWVILVGALCSTFGAGLQSMCSAPRLLYSISKDDTIPLFRIFGVTTKKNEPIRAAFITALIAEIFIMPGSVDFAASTVQLFFLTCYASINMVCTFQSILKDPNWRPRFRYYHWAFSLVGTILCIAIMFVTNWYMSLVILLAAAAIYKFVQWKGAKKEWGDGMRGIALSTAQYSLLRLEEKDHPHPKNWRPQLMILVNMNTDGFTLENERMLSLASQLKEGQGLAMVLSIIDGDLIKARDREKAVIMKEKIKEKMASEKLPGFVDTVVAEPPFYQALKTAMQTVGIGALKPNAILVGWPYAWQERCQTLDSPYLRFLETIHRASEGRRSLIIPKGIRRFPGKDTKLSGNIDIWWIMQDGGLLLLIPFLLKRSKVWRGCSLRLFTISTPEDDSVKLRQDLERWCYQLRISVTVEIVEISDASAISAYSYEKTMKIRERMELLKSMADAQKEPQLVRAKARTKRPSNLDTIMTDVPTLPLDPTPVGSKVLDDEISTGTQFTFNPQSLKTKTLQAQFAATFAAASTSGTTLGPKSCESGLDLTQRIKKLHSAVHLNEVIRSKSQRAELVVVNLPPPPHNLSGFYVYLDYVEELTKKLDRVLLLRGTGTEIITIYS